jgi:hypothetical protein
VARVRIYYSQAKRESQEDAERFVREVLRQIRFQARIHIVFGPYTTGALAASLRVRGPFLEFGRVAGSVGSDLAYSAAVEGGSGLYGPKRSKYPIYPVRAKKLRFYWRKVGRVVSLPRVSHPGQRGKNYLLKAAQSVSRRHNMILVIHEL